MQGKNCDFIAQLEKWISKKWKKFKQIIDKMHNLMYNFHVIKKRRNSPVGYMDYIKALIDFLMKLISFFKQNENIEEEEKTVW